MTETPARISASQVRLILERAAEMDARGDSLTVEELRRIAAEAEIDPAATETAIQEITASIEATPPPTPTVTEKGAKLPAKNPKSPSPAWIATGGAVGMALGFLTALPELVGISGFGATVLYLVLRAVQSMKKSSQLSFQLQNFAVWFGMAVGATAIGVFSDDETFAAALLFGTLSSVIGGLIVRFGPREKEPEDDVQRIGPGEQ